MLDKMLRVSIGTSFEYTVMDVCDDTSSDSGSGVKKSFTIFGTFYFVGEIEANQLNFDF